jgi:hypothetical protein
VAGELGEAIARQVAEVSPEIPARFCVIRHALVRASQTGSRLEAQRSNMEKGRLRQSEARNRAGLERPVTP